MKLFTKAQHARLLSNGSTRREHGTRPVVKLFTPDAQCTWLLSEIDPGDPDQAFGLCDLGMGSPELGYVSLAELRSVRGKLRLPIERDRHFRPVKTLADYAREAWDAGRITA